MHHFRLSPHHGLGRANGRFGEFGIQYGRCLDFMRQVSALQCADKVAERTRLSAIAAMESFGSLVQREAVVASLDTVLRQGANAFQLGLILAGIQIQPKIAEPLQIKLATVVHHAAPPTIARHMFPTCSSGFRAGSSPPDRTFRSRLRQR